MSPEVGRVPGPPTGQVRWYEWLRGQGQRPWKSVWEDVGLQVEQKVVV